MPKPSCWYEILPIKIGSGAFSNVFQGLCRKPLRKTFDVAIKCILKSHTSLKEAEIMESLPAHPNIVTFYDTWKNPQSERVFIAMELIENGIDLKKWTSSFERNDPILPLRICQILLQIFAAISHIHAHLIFHGDIKPTNIMIVEKENGDIEIKIIDFGLSSHFDYIPQKYRGSPLFFSPEIAHLQGIDHRSDIWAMGILIIQILSREEKPWFLKDAMDIDNVISELKTLDFDRTPFPRKLLEHEDPNIVFLARMAQRCLALDKSERPTAQICVTELMDKIAELSSA